MRVIVCGGRDYDNIEVVNELIATFPPHAIVVNGGAEGADRLARQAARAAGLRVETYPANWESNGKAAGPIRNAMMATLPDVEAVYALPGGRGTADMVRQADRQGIEVYHVS